MTHLALQFQVLDGFAFWEVAGKTFPACQYPNARQVKVIRLEKTIDSHLSGSKKSPTGAT